MKKFLILFLTPFLCQAATLVGIDRAELKTELKFNCAIDASIDFETSQASVSFLKDENCMNLSDTDPHFPLNRKQRFSPFPFDFKLILDLNSPADQLLYQICSEPMGVISLSLKGNQVTHAQSHPSILLFWGGGFPLDR